MSLGGWVGGVHEPPEKLMPTEIQMKPQHIHYYLWELTNKLLKMTRAESPGNAFEYVQDPQSHQFHLSGTDLEDIPTCLDNP